MNIKSSSNMLVGDKIEIVDGFGTSESNSILSIIDVNNIEIVNPTDSSFFVGENARVKVLRNNFTNNHIHKVRQNEAVIELLEDNT